MTLTDIEIGVLGGGSMGQEIISFLTNRKIKNANLVSIFDKDQNRLDNLSKILPANIFITNSIDKFLSVGKIRLVVESASAEAVKQYGSLILNSNKNLVVMSSGVFNDINFLNSLENIAEKKSLQLLIPSGAVGGIDSIKAIKDQIKKISITTTKSPKSLMGALGFKEYENVVFKKEQIIFKGNSQQAIKLFPANVNVSSTLSLVGIGPQKTDVTIICDPNINENKHEICVEGAFGQLNFSMNLHPSKKNPKTSSLAIFSVIEKIRTFCNPHISIGT